MPHNRAATPLSSRKFLKIAGIGGTFLSTVEIRRSSQSAPPDPSTKASLTIFDFGDANAGDGFLSTGESTGASHRVLVPKNEA